MKKDGELAGDEASMTSVPWKDRPATLVVGLPAEKNLGCESGVLTDGMKSHW